MADSTEKMQVLLVDDDPLIFEQVKLYLRPLLFVELSYADSTDKAYKLFREREFDLLLLDLSASLQTGVGWEKVITSFSEKLSVAMVTSDDRAESVVECMKHGAIDYLVKPLEPGRLLVLINHVRSLLELKRDVALLSAGSQGQNPAFRRIITRSPLMKELFVAMERVARSPLAVLISGESGVGKELVAGAIHELSGRPGEFVPVNAAGLDDTLFSDTLFGHRKGAFTGAAADREGLVKKADAGTLFLDEIGDIGPEAQIKLLRFLQEGEYYPLGSDRALKSTARLVLATNVDLWSRVKEGKFRADLYYRLMIHLLSIPPLRERKEDIPLLVEFFVKNAASTLGVPLPTDTGPFLKALEGWNFPGNIRELSALVHGALSQMEGGILTGTTIKEYLRSLKGLDSQQTEGVCSDEHENSGAFLTLEELSERHIRLALQKAGGNQSKAAELLGISQSTISRYLKKSSMQHA